MGDLCFVLVAGGAGERFGFGSAQNPRIGISMLAEVTTETTFLEMYCQYILAFQARAQKDNPSIKLPLLIMTAEGENDKMTSEYLKANNYFGLTKVKVET